jgi:ATP-dependent Clp protease, protease subunit
MATTPPPRPAPGAMPRPGVAAMPQSTPAPPKAPLVYVSFVGPIIPQTTQVLLDTFAGLARQQVQSVYLLFSTGGGQVMEGVAIYTILRALPLTLTTHNIGNVDSIGNIIFLAGSPRYASAAATFMFHGVGLDIVGPMRLEEKNLTERLDTIKTEHRKLSAIIASRSTLPQNEAEDLFAKQETKDAAYARSKGIIDDIRDVNIPAGTPYVHIRV